MKFTKLLTERKSVLNHSARHTNTHIRLHPRAHTSVNILNGQHFNLISSLPMGKPLGPKSFRLVDGRLIDTFYLRFDSIRFNSIHSLFSKELSKHSVRQSFIRCLSTASNSINTLLNISLKKRSEEEEKTNFGTHLGTYICPGLFSFKQILFNHSWRIAVCHAFIVSLKLECIAE